MLLLKSKLTLSSLADIEKLMSDILSNGLLYSKKGNMLQTSHSWGGGDSLDGKFCHNAVMRIAQTDFA